MKTLKPNILLTLALWALTTATHAQNYSIDWHKIAGGGGTSTGGVYSVAGTIGQPDAGGAMAGGGHSLTGGFWSMVAAVPTATPIVTWTNPAPFTYGAALSAVQLNATASVPGTEVYSPPAGTVLAAGTNALSLVFWPADATDYNSLTTSVTLVVLPAPLTVTANDAARPYGAGNPPFTGTITAIQNGDAISATYSCSATTAAAPGTYPILPTLVGPKSLLANYQVTLVNGTLTVTPGAPPAIVSVTPSTGPTNGGTTVTILGTGFESGATVNFGALPAGPVVVINSTNLTAVTPPSVPGAVLVVVTNADGQSTTLTNGFTYVAPSGAPPVFRAVTHTAGTVTLVWSATAGQTYQVQYKTNWFQPDWAILATVTATNSTATVSDALTSAQRFYRAVWLP